MTAALVVDAFAKASMMRRPRVRLLFHSDCGVQYCSATLPMLTRSLSRKGNCWDNACAESFFKTLKREVEELDGRTSRRKVKSAVFEYIVYYNRKRLHSQNGYKPPAMVDMKVA
jgi:transposase InsO family protein